MAVRASKFVSVLAGGLFAGMPLAIAEPAPTAPDCLTAPRQDTPQGQHWYFHVERGTKRHCWYLREEGGKVAQTAPSADSSAAPSADSSSAADASAGQAEPAARSIEDARAEFPEPQPTAQDNAGNAPAQAAPAATPGATSAASSPFPDPPQAVAEAGSPVASRWPASNAANSSAAPPPVAANATDPEPNSQPATNSQTTTNSQTATPAVTPAPSADGSPPRASAPPSASLQMLLVVILGALALAGLTASIVYRLSRGRQIRIDSRQRRAAIWEGVDEATQPPWAEPVIEETVSRPHAAHSMAPTTVPQERYHVPQERHQKIEELLAELVKQAQQSDA